MRWSDEGAHLLSQVRAHEINGDLRPRVVPMPLRPPKPTSHTWLDGYELASSRKQRRPHSAPLPITPCRHGASNSR
jgi:hypothetical protein